MTGLSFAGLSVTSLRFASLTVTSIYFTRKRGYKLDLSELKPVHFIINMSEQPLH